MARAKSMESAIVDLIVNDISRLAKVWGRKKWLQKEGQKLLRKERQ